MKAKQFFYSFLVLTILLILLLSIRVVLSNPVEYTSPVTTIDWHPDGVLLASGSEDDTVKIWDTSLGSVVLAFDFTSSVYSVDWSPDGLNLAIGLADGTMSILDVEQEKEILPLQGARTETQHRDYGVGKELRKVRFLFV